MNPLPALCKRAALPMSYTPVMLGSPTTKKHILLDLPHHARRLRQVGLCYPSGKGSDGIQPWRRTDSNRSPAGCKPAALPDELHPQALKYGTSVGSRTLYCFSGRLHSFPGTSNQTGTYLNLHRLKPVPSPRGESNPIPLFGRQMCNHQHFKGMSYVGLRGIEPRPSD